MIGNFCQRLRRVALHILCLKKTVHICVCACICVWVCVSMFCLYVLQVPSRLCLHFHGTVLCDRPWSRYSTSSIHLRWTVYCNSSGCVWHLQKSGKGKWWTQWLQNVSACLTESGKILRLYKEVRRKYISCLVKGRTCSQSLLGLVKLLLVTLYCALGSYRNTFFRFVFTGVEKYEVLFTLLSFLKTFVSVLTCFHTNLP